MAEVSEPIAITLCYAPRAGQVCEYHLSVAAGCTAGQAIAQQKQALMQPEARPALLAELRDWSQNCVSHPQPGWTLGVWGKKCDPGTTLYNGDRLELYRQLCIDPKIARRDRFSQQAKSAGLFSMRCTKR